MGQNFVWVGQARVWVGHGLSGLIARTASGVVSIFMVAAPPTCCRAYLETLGYPQRVYGDPY